MCTDTLFLYGFPLTFIPVGDATFAMFAKDLPNDTNQTYLEKIFLICIFFIHYF